MTRWIAAFVGCLVLVPLAALTAAQAAQGGADQPEGPQQITLTLDKALEIARAQNLTVLTALEDIKRTRGILREGYSSAYPRLTLDGSYTRTDPSSISSLETPEGSFTLGSDETYSYAFGLEQRVYAGGLVSGGIRAARDEKARVLEIVATTIQDIELQVRRDFYELLLAQELVLVRQEAVALFEENLRNAEARFQAGTVAKFEVTRAKVELANLQPPLIAAKNRVRLAEEALKKTLNVPFDTELTIEGKLDYTPTHFSLDALVDTALQFRHEIKAAELVAALRKINVTVEASTGRPDVRAFANYGGQTDTFGTSATDLTEGWNAGLRVSIPIFRGWGVAGRVDQARAEHGKALIALEDQRKVVELEVRRAFFNLENAAEVVASQQENVGQAEEAVHEAVAQLQAGEITQFELRDTQLSLTQARTNLKQAQHDYNVALFTLERAVGVRLTAPGSGE
ncbi:MAG: TolC family protein [Verrucomicrobia bacterium]|nr:TolC family protein [Verrucomicrobiota bacterium]